MQKKIVRFAVFAAVIGLGGIWVHAGTTPLGTTGWEAFWDSSLDGVVNIQVDPGNGVIVEKFANFLNSSPITVGFRQTSGNASPTLTLQIDSEFLVNNSGAPWTGFQMSVQNASSGTAADATFNQGLSNVGQAGGFSINPFANAAFSADSTVLTLSGGTPVGTTAPGNVFQPGVASGQLVINTSPTASGSPRQFLLVEGPPGEVPPIPLPAAAWSGLSGLLGLGALSAVRKLRNLLS